MIWRDTGVQTGAVFVQLGVRGMIMGSENLGILECGIKRPKLSYGKNIRNELIESFLVNPAIYDDLRKELKDLQFIVKHLREDISCTIENGKEGLKSSLQAEIGLLVYSLMEESIKERINLKNELRRLQEENEILLENEGAVLEEMAKLTIENEQIKSKVHTKEVEDMAYYAAVIEQTKMIISETANEFDELEGGVHSTIDGIITSKEKLSKLLSNEICSLKLDLEQLRSDIKEKNEVIKAQLAENGQLKSIISGNEVKISELLENQNESEQRMRELLTMNCELMDLSEVYKEKELEKSKKEETEAEAEKAKNEEIELLKKTITSQRIELEKTRETLVRERKISSLKISDLREQLAELSKDNVKDASVNEVSSDNLLKI